MNGRPVVRSSRCSRCTRAVRTAVSVMLLVTVVPFLSGGEAVSITLRPEVEVAADGARLSDLADIVGDAATRSILGGIVVQATPGVGSWTVDAGLVKSVLARQAPEVAVSISGTATVKRPAERIETEAMATAAQAHLTQRFGEAERSIEVLRSGQALVLPADRTHPVSLVAEPLTDAAWGEVPYRIRAVRGERELARALVVLKARIWREVPIADRDLVRGTVLSLTDLRLVRRELDTATGAAPVALADLVGRSLMRAVAAGSPVLVNMTRPQVLVHSGDPVTVLLKRDRFQVSGAGVATADGIAGGKVNVKLPNGVQIEARVVAAGQVEIGS